MDRDGFARAPRLARQVAKSIERELRGAAGWDLSLPAQLLDLVYRQAGGIPSAAGVIEAVSLPLFTHSGPDAVIDLLDSIVLRSTSTMLDPILQRAAQREILRAPAVPEDIPQRIFNNFFMSCFERWVVDGKGCLLERYGSDFVERHRDKIRRLLQPCARKAANILCKNPQAKSLGLAREYKLTVDDDLLHPRSSS